VSGWRRGFPEVDSTRLLSDIDDRDRSQRTKVDHLHRSRLRPDALDGHEGVAVIRGDIGEIVGSVLERARKILVQHRVAVDIAKDLPMLDLDPVLFEQVLFNLLDNAAKYASPQTTVLIQSWQEGETIKLQILDEGGGIPPEELDRIFDKFHRAEKQDQVRAGTGLGLAISRGFIEAMGGTITAANRADRPGAVFTIALPVPKPAARLDTAA